MGLTICPENYYWYTTIPHISDLYSSAMLYTHRQYISIHYTRHWSHLFWHYTRHEQPTYIFIRDTGYPYFYALYETQATYISIRYERHRLPIFLYSIWDTATHISICFIRYRLPYFYTLYEIQATDISIRYVRHWLPIFVYALWDTGYPYFCKLYEIQAKVYISTGIRTANSNSNSVLFWKPVT